MRDEFYVNLFSNASLDIFHDNSLSKFKVQLSQPIILNEPYEVALEELNFPFSIKNVTSPSNELYLVRPTDVGKVEGSKQLLIQPKRDFIALVKSALRELFGPKTSFERKGKCYSLSFQRNNALRMSPTLSKKLGFAEIVFGTGQPVEGSPVEEDTFDREVQVELTRVKHLMTQDRIEILEGFYESPEDLINAINSAYQSHLKLNSSKILLRYNPYIKVVELQLHHSGYILINAQLSHMLGFGQKSVYTSFSVADRDVILFPSNYIFAYCDIIEAEHVGDVKAPLLRVVPFVASKRNEMISYSFNLPQYKKVIVKEVSTICLELVGERGSYIPFLDGSGRVAATLHFRRCT